MPTYTIVAEDRLDFVARALRDLTYTEMRQLGEMLYEHITNAQAQEDIIIPSEIAEAVSNWADGYNKW